VILRRTFLGALPRRAARRNGTPSRRRRIVERPGDPLLDLLPHPARGLDRLRDRLPHGFTGVAGEKMELGT